MLSGAKTCKLVDLVKSFQTNIYLLLCIGVDTAENEPLKDPSSILTPRNQNSYIYNVSHPWDPIEALERRGPDRRAAVPVAWPAQRPTA